MIFQELSYGQFLESSRHFRERLKTHGAGGIPADNLDMNEMAAFKQHPPISRYFPLALSLSFSHTHTHPPHSFINIVEYRVK